MLGGCYSALLSPTGHRLRSEATAAFQACQIPKMSTQRLDLPCSFVRKDASRPQPVRPVGISVDNPVVEAKTAGCSLRQSIKLPPEEIRESRNEFWEKKKNKSVKKRFAAEVSFDDEESCVNRAKRKRGNAKLDEEEQRHLSLGHVSNEDYWLGSQVPFSLSCSGEEGGRVCFVPTSLVSPPLPPLSNIPWFESVVTETTTDLGNVEAIEGREEGSGSSSTSSDSHGLILAPTGTPPKVEDIGTVPSPPNPIETPQIIAGHGAGNNNHREQHECVELVNLLVACAEQIGSKNISAVHHCLVRLGELASPRGSPVHRLIAYFTEALALRVARLWPHIFHITIPRELDRADDESGTALRLLNEVTPIPKFIHFTANEILLRAFEGRDRIHIIDFDIKQGLQWPGLFQSLASRGNPPSHVRITGIGESKQELVETGERLSRFAEALRLPFEFHPVADRLEDVRLWMLHVKEKETVAVNCVFQLHKMLYDATEGTVRDFLGLIHSTKAELVVVAEQEAAHNKLSLNARLCNALKYYSAVFDSIDSSLPVDSGARIKIEEMFAREIRNIIACEGRYRSERHETFDKWEQVMHQGGFRCFGITERERLQGRMMLRMYSSCESYGVEERREGSITLSWLDQPLYTVSAWMPADVAGSSSLSSSQPS